MLTTNVRRDGVGRGKGFAGKAGVAIEGVAWTAIAALEDGDLVKVELPAFAPTAGVDTSDGRLLGFAGGAVEVEGLPVCALADESGAKLDGWVELERGSYKVAIMPSSA